MLLRFGFVFLVAFFVAINAKKIPRWWLKVAQRQGPNACVVEEIPGTNREFWTECRYWLNRKICGRKTRLRFECCEGYDHTDEEDGCTLVKPLKSVLETAEDIGATKWANYIRESGLEASLNNGGPYTLFAPTNDAFDNAQYSVQRQLDAYKGIPFNPVIRYHLIPSRVKSDEFEGDNLYVTENEGQKIRVNKYSNGMTTINCALLVRKDQEATNGIVHLIEGVLDPAISHPNSIADAIINDGRFEFMAEMLQSSGYVNVLRTLPDSHSVLVPSDEAFQKLTSSRREKIMNDQNLKMAILQNHVVPHVVCESAVTGEHKVRTVSDTHLTFDCDLDGTYVEDTKLTEDYVMGNNGILHVINDVLLPDRAKTLVELAESRSLTTFVDLVKSSGLDETLEHTGDYTFFVPDETAWAEMTPELKIKARQDPEFAGTMLRFHGAYGRHLTNAINDNQGIMSLDEENPIRLQVWRRSMGVEDAKIIEPNIEAQNGVIHIINKMIFPSNQTIETVLESIRTETFYTFQDLLSQVMDQNPSFLSLGPGDGVYYTLFIPTDEAFDAYGQGRLASIISNPTEAGKLLVSHVALNMFPKTSFDTGLTYSIEGLGSDFKIKKSLDGSITVNGANVINSYMSTNGVIYVIDEVFEPSDSHSYVINKMSSSTVTSTGGGHSTTYTYSSTRKTYGSRHSQSATTNEKFGGTFPQYPEEIKKFSYIGHPYGQDVPGHVQPSIPFSSAESTSSDENYEIKEPVLVQSNGRKYAIHRKTSSRMTPENSRIRQILPKPVHPLNTT